MENDAAVADEFLELFSQSSLALEWDRFIDIAADLAFSIPGQSKVESLGDETHWAPDRLSAQGRQDESREMVPVLDRSALWGPLRDLDEPDGAIERLRRMEVLSLKELALVRGWFVAMDAWNEIPREEFHGRMFLHALEALPDPHLPLRALDSVLTPSGDLSDQASPQLGVLTRQIRSVRLEISAKMDELLRKYSSDGYLQQDFTDVRDGRYVLPVRTSAQGKVEGRIYDSSASRQTVFIEPVEVERLNNQLRRLENDYSEEVYRILKELSDALRPHGEDLEIGVGILAHWDAVQARARMGLRYGGHPIQITEDRSLELPYTAHPLLWWSLDEQEIVKNTVEIDAPTRVLLITGPNTGGKTVLLKTVGIAGICARTGFPFPSRYQSKVPFFDSFFVDVGDAQSIERKISSFSGHLLKFKEILEGITPNSLVLLDELNTATDPQEGAALGRAFLETLLKVDGSLVFATTHDPHLKSLAADDERILNSSMQFDESSREPTYRLVTGMAGRSRALEIAEKLGIPKEVLDLARSYLTSEHVALEKLLERMESDMKEAERARRMAEKAQAEAEQIRKEWLDKSQGVVISELDRTREKLKRLVSVAQEEIRSKVQLMQSRTTHQSVAETRRAVEDAFQSAKESIDRTLREEVPDLLDQVSGGAEETENSENFTVGDAVRVPRWKSFGRIVDVKGKKWVVRLGGPHQVDAGSLTMTLSLSDMVALTDEEKKRLGLTVGSRPTAMRTEMNIEADDEVESSIDLRGKRLDEAMSLLESYLDRAVRSGKREVTIIHGVGTGAIREGTKKLLNSLPYVKSQQDGGLGAGGAGATVVEFEKP